MASPESLECLKKTRAALQDIQAQLLPFLRDLGVDAATDPKAPRKQQQQQQQQQGQKMIQASMAVALAMGTLRYMGARLRGLDRGRKPDDPLRQELNTMRKRMVALQKKLDQQSKTKETLKRKTGAENEKEAKKEEEASPEPAAKRRKGRRS